MKTFGQFESIAYRSFTKMEYAMQFLSGQIRFGHIYKYKKIENNKLRDETEGEGHVQINGRISRSMFASNSIYIYCFHRSLESTKHANFGPIIVEIEKPKSIADLITQNLAERKDKIFGGVEGVIIDYDKGEERPNELSTLEKSRLTYSQKLKVPFYIENEFRFVFLCKENYGDTFEINLGKSLKNCRIINDI